MSDDSVKTGVVIVKDMALPDKKKGFPTARTNVVMDKAMPAVVDVQTGKPVVREVDGEDDDLTPETRKMPSTLAKPGFLSRIFGRKV